MQVDDVEFLAYRVCAESKNTYAFLETKKSCLEEEMQPVALEKN